MSHVMRKLVFGVNSGFNSIQPVVSQKLARVLKFWIYNLQVLLMRMHRLTSVFDVRIFFTTRLINRTKIAALWSYQPRAFDNK